MTCAPITSLATDARGMKALCAFWDEMADFSAGEMDAALRHLMEWFACEVGADNVIWLGAIRVLRGPEVKADPFSGWRLRVRRTLVPDSEAYQKVIAAYYSNEHYGKLTSSYYQPHEIERSKVHGGITGHVMMARAGKFRIYLLRDGWIDFAKFQKSEHYQLYYLDQDVTDRMWIGFPLNADTESIFLVDQVKLGRRSRQFTQREAILAALAVRGLREFHRRTLLYHGLLQGEKPLSALERQILQGLLTSRTEKEIAEATGQKLSTMHKYVTSIYTQFRVQGRAALMALWLGSK